MCVKRWKILSFIKYFTLKVYRCVQENLYIRAFSLIVKPMYVPSAGQMYGHTLCMTPSIKFLLDPVFKHRIQISNKNAFI